MQFLFQTGIRCVLPAQIAELFHEIEDRDDALAKAREAAHKAQLQKYQARQNLDLKRSIKEVQMLIASILHCFSRE